MQLHVRLKGRKRTIDADGIMDDDPGDYRRHQKNRSCDLSDDNDVIFTIYFRAFRTGRIPHEPF